jgi:hypothetical protein
MGFENVPRCRHIKINGTQCKSPALRRRRFCFFHQRVREQRARIAADQFAQRPFETPVLEDANSVQMALMQLMQMIAMRRIEHKEAGMLLYALQTASVNMRSTRFEAMKPTDVVIDRDTVRWTCIDGPQWVEEDFEPDEEDENDGEPEGDEDAEEEAEAQETVTRVETKKVEVKEKSEVQAAVAPPSAKKPPQSAPGSVKLPVARPGETALETFKRLVAATEKRPLSG